MAGSDVAPIEQESYACKEILLTSPSVTEAFHDEVLALRFLKGRTENVSKLEACFIHEDRSEDTSTGYLVFKLADYTLEGYIKANQPIPQEQLREFLESASKLISCLTALHHPHPDSDHSADKLRAVGVHHDLVCAYT